MEELIHKIRAFASCHNDPSVWRCIQPLTDKILDLIKIEQLGQTPELPDYPKVILFLKNKGSKLQMGFDEAKDLHEQLSKVFGSHQWINLQPTEGVYELPVPNKE